MKQAIIIGGTSGIGKELCRLLLKDKWALGIAGRNENALREWVADYPGQVRTAVIDITSRDAAERLNVLIRELGEIDLFVHCSGIGLQNMQLEENIEVDTARTNVEGFMRMVDAAYRYFRERGRGHIAVINSIAGTKGLGAAPAYSATKRFQRHYIDSLDQLAHLQNVGIQFTDIRPGFVSTPLLGDGNHYPLLMEAPIVAAHILQAIYDKKRVATIDWRYRLLVFFWQLVPNWLWVRLPVATRKDKK